jgi:Ca2+:H+ antiporter
MVQSFYKNETSFKGELMIKNLKKKINWLLLTPYMVFVSYFILSSSEQSFVVSLIECVLLAVAIMVSVYHAEEIAHDIGEGLGALVLALSVTVIEVGLILTLMSTGQGETSTIARDTVFSAVMIVCNGIVGICILLGGLKYKEVGFQFRGANSLLVVLISLSVFCFVLPNYTTSVLGPYYNTSQLIFVSIISVLLYFALVLTQTKTHKYYFESEQEIPLNGTEQIQHGLFSKKVLINFAALSVGLVSVIVFSKLIAPMIESGVERAGAPKAIVGLLIATIVLLPEAITAIYAARQNRIQTSLNLALGSGAASIALTIPVVSAYSIWNNQPLALGLDPKGMVFLILTFITGALTLGNGRATALQGFVHLIIMIAYFVVTLVP